MEDLEGAYEDAMNADGSAMAENEKYLDSIEGKVTLFKAATQSMWSDFIDSKTIKFVVDLGTNLIQLVETIGLLPTALGAVASYIVLIKNKGLTTMFSDVKTGMKDFKAEIAAMQQISQIQAMNTGAGAIDGQAFNAESINAYANAVKSLTEQQQVAKLASAGLTEEQIKQVLAINGVSDANAEQALSEAAVTAAKTASTKATGANLIALANENGLKLSSAATDWLKEQSTEEVTEAKIKDAVATGALTGAQAAEITTALGLTGANFSLSASFKALAAGIKAAMMSNPLTALLTVATTIISVILPLIETLAESFRNSAEAARELTEEYKNTKKELDDDLDDLAKSSDSDTYETLTDEFKHLTQGVNMYGENISLTTDEYERYKEICEMICDMNPSLIAGYDSATEAIGRNANALQELVDLKNEEARLNAAEFISYGAFSNNKNFKKLSKAAIKDYKSANNAMQEYTLKTGDFYGADYIFDGFESGITGENTARRVMQILGYEDSEIDELASDYKKMGGFDFDRWFQDYMAEIYANQDLVVAALESEKKHDNSRSSQRRNREIDEAIAGLQETADGYEIAAGNLEASADNMIDAYLQIPLALKEYEQLTSGEQSLLTAWIQNDDMFKIDENTTKKDIAKNKAKIISMVRKLASEDFSTTIDGVEIEADIILDTIFSFNPSELNYEEYQAEIKEWVNYLWEAIGGENNKFGIKDKNELMVMFGIEFVPEEDENELIDDIVRITGMTEEEAKEWVASQPALVIQRMVEYDYDPVGPALEGEEPITADDMAEMAVPNINYIEPKTIKTYAALSEEISNYDELLAQTNELTGDNVEITQEYKDSLMGLDFTTEELEEFNSCFDENNGLIVTNTTKLRELIAAKEESIAADVKAAKAQSQLEYYDLVQQLDATLDGVTELDDETIALTESILDQIDIVRKAINNYQRLETTLLGVTNGFTKFKEAQEIDSQNTYGDDYVEMAQTMYDAYYVTGEVGTEANWAAIEALVPDWVYKHLETDGERMKAIYEYFNNEILPTLTIDEGQLSLGYEDVERFVEYGLRKDIGIFEGTIDNFRLVEGMDLETAAELMGTTVEQAYVYFALLDDFTTGNGLSFLAQLDNSLSGQMMKTTSEMERLNEEKFALLQGGEDGIVSDEEWARIEEINSQLATCDENLDEIGQTALESWKNFKHFDMVLSLLGEVEDKTVRVKDVFSDEVILELGLNGEDTVQDAYNDILDQRSQFEQIDATSAGAAIDALDDEIAVLEDYRDKNVIFEADKTVLIELGVEIDEDMTREEIDQKVQEAIDERKLDKAELATEFGIALSEEEEEDLKKELEAIEEFEISNKEFFVTDKGTIKIVKTALEELENFNLTGKTVLIEGKYSSNGAPWWVWDDVQADGTVHADGTAHAEGTAFKTGSWGAPETEEALVGELGPELLVRDGKWTTIGDSGAEFEHIEKGDIIFNHKQTEDLLSKGYVTGRGKSYAEGTAYEGGVFTSLVKPAGIESTEDPEYSSVFEEMEVYNELLAETNENIVDNTIVTNEYRESLKEIGFTQEELNACFDEDNKLMVKNSRLLKRLVAEKKKEKRATVQQARANAQLDYQYTIKDIGDLVDVMEDEIRTQGYVSDATLETSKILHSHVDALEDTIQAYALLELQMSDAAESYNEFERAQQRDAELSWGDTAIEGMEAIDEGFRTGKVGSETFQAAVELFVPEEVYANLEGEERLDAIYKYIDENLIGKYFTLDKNGNYSIDFKNVETFVKEGIEEKGVFTGTLEDFELSEGIDSLEDFAAAMGVTEEVALAMLSELEKYDARWGNILTDLTTNDLDQNILDTAKALEDAYTAQEEFILGGGDINSEEYKRLTGQVLKAEVAYNRATAAAEANTQSWNNINKMLLANAGYMQLTKEEAEALARELGFVDANGNLTVTINDDGTFALTSGQLNDLIDQKNTLTEPGMMEMQITYDTLDAEITGLGNIKNKLENGAVLDDLDDTELTILYDVGLDPNSDTLEADIAAKKTELESTQEVITLTYGITQASSDQGGSTIEQLTELQVNGVNITVTANTQDAQTAITELNENPAQDQEIEIDANHLSALSKIGTIQQNLNNLKNKTINISVNYSTTGAGKVDGTAHVSGTAFKSGTWGAEQSETALVGELGPELLVRNGRWTTVGENGAEFTDVRKGDIIFNHKQTEELLSKGHVTGRGKAFAEGNAYGYGLYDKYMTTGNSAFKGSGAADKLSNAAKSVSDAADEFKEVFDWIEVRLEEINEDISFKSAQLENAIGSSKQNKIIDDLIDLNRALYDNLLAGASEYYAYAEKLLAKVPEGYREAAKNGAIAIETFTGKVGEDALEAIQEYREWVQKGDDVTQQAEEALTEISSLAKQAIDNIASDYENKKSLQDIKIEQYEAYNALLETDVGYESAKIYQAMIQETNKSLKTLEEQRNKMQAELNKRVEAGEIKKYSQDWYDAINDIAAVDTEIIELKTDTEDWQDAINELHWDQFDYLMERFEAISEEAENLIDILSSKELVDEAGNWTEEGITSLGLYAQQMEVAEMQAQRYKDEISYLNKNWEKLGYTEQEYVEKLEELKSGQYDAIKAYNDTKDAIVDLNKERVDAIKEGIQKEIEAYQELIEAKKEELDAEKDLYDFQKGVKNQQKEIADIERQLAALSGDNSASARAKRAQLQAELIEAQAALEETYYDRSMSKQQEALDKELENFQEEKDKEIEGWEEYLEETEKVVSDSLTTIQANTDVVYQTLKEMGSEYSLSITESLTSPWKEGEYAIQSYSEKFGLSMSATVDELKELKTEFDAFTEDIEKAGSNAVTTVQNSTTSSQSAEYVPPVVNNNTSNSDSSNSGDTNSSSSNSSNTSSSTGKSYPYGKASAVSGTIKQGAKGNSVKAIQYALNKLGYGNSGTKKLDGVFGSGTTSAVKAFQRAMGISADGMVGSKTKQKFKAKGYAIGTTGVDEDQWALIDELGEELVLHAQNGKLAYLTKGSAVIPHDISENIMELGQLDPSAILERNKPQIGLPTEIHNIEVHIDNSIAELIHIDNCSTETLPDVKKIVNEALEKHTKQLNNSLKKFVR